MGANSALKKRLFYADSDQPVSEILSSFFQYNNNPILLINLKDQENPVILYFNETK